MDTIIRDFPYQNWITIIFVVCLISLAVAKSFYYQQFVDFINLRGADRYISNRTRGSFFFEPLQLVLLIIQCTGISLLIFTAYCIYYEVEFRDNIKVFGLVLLGYSLFEVFKFLVERFISYALRFYNRIQPFLYKRLNLKNALGLFALCCSLVFAYHQDINHQIVYIILSSIVFIYFIYQLWLLRLYRDDFIRFPFYFILYFCTLEIAPYFILYKFIANG
ncbi:DUF4271 domain-containing protein [Dokdonia sp. Hel1_53]|uniref:DUF4271 domain-containing protein n=1 Tax=Dokdonia sp. Hel_I_53 TaxID=1566287 RepID=UPI00119B3B5F|nr:uncharacterized protein DUF4271 [Dokdonia sp. Hel_I_53]